jgi:NADPH2:quinone reductase
MPEHSNQAVVVDTASASRLAVRPVPMPTPREHEALVRVTTISLNRGEINRAFNAVPDGWRPGWDLAGVVERAAANGSGPVPGTGVVGFLADGAWANFVAVPTDALAAIPDGATPAQGATLPVAGLTALHALRQGGLLLGKKVLITGASGGVGDFALQLARLAGAGAVVAHIRSARQEAEVRASGATSVVIGDTPAGATAQGPFDLIVESVGGDVLGAALGMLARDGVCAVFGASGSGRVTFDLTAFFRTGRARLYGLSLFAELAAVENASIGLSRLLRLVAAGSLQPRISVEASWREVGRVARDLIDRRFTGKAVLHLDG